MTTQKTVRQHWPVLLLAVAVLAIFAISMFVFTVQETEYALVLRRGNPATDANGNVKVYGPGLHWKLCPPFETVWRHDKRIYNYMMVQGQTEQNPTKDGYQVLVSNSVFWRVSEAHADVFMRSVGDTEKAEEALNGIVRNARNAEVAKYELGQLINVDEGKIRIDQIEKDVRDSVNAIVTEKYGIEVVKVGFRNLSFPADVAGKVFDRMKADRTRISEKLRSEGANEAAIIGAEAKAQADRIISKAEAEAKITRGEGDKEAAKFYAVFDQNPELAIFLRKLDALRTSVGPNTTLVFDSTMPPFDLLQPDVLKQIPAPKKASGQKPQ